MKWLRWLGGFLLVALGVIAALLKGRRPSGERTAAGAAKREAEVAADDANELNRDADAREREAADIRANAEKELADEHADEDPDALVARWNERLRKRSRRVPRT